MLSMLLVTPVKTDFEHLLKFKERELFGVGEPEESSNYREFQYLEETI
jgi:hypothetical protein